MTIIRAYTTIEQSKKLAEILPIETSDMIYTVTNGYHTPFIRIETIEELYEDDVCAWSLAALLSVLPNNGHINTTISRGSWKIEPVEYLPNIWWCQYEDEKRDKEFNISADNPVDAAFEMIIKLHELKML